MAEKEKRVRVKSEKDRLIARLNRIEGQVRGVKSMLERDEYCTDIITQVSAICGALNSFNRVMISSHIKCCVANDLKLGKEDKVDELVETLQKLMR